MKGVINLLGKRGKDKRSISLKEKLNQLNIQLDEENKLAFVKLGDFISDYIISSRGVLYKIDKSKGTIKIIHPYIEKDGHLRVGLYHEDIRTKKYIHQLVAEAFIPNPKDKPEIHHKDGDEFNNDKNNLMWVTRKEHAELTKNLSQYVGVRGSANPASSSTDEQIEEVCKLIEENKLYPEEICEKTGITYAQFQHIMHEENSWKYIKEKYDLSKYNKYKRRMYSKEDKEKFIKLKKEFPNYTLRKIAELLDIRYAAIKNWNRILV